MRPIRSSLFIVPACLLALLSSVPSAAAPQRTPGDPPTITALVEPPDGAALTAADRPTFAWEATPGGRFRVQFSSSLTPFIPVLDSGRRTTPGDQYKPSLNEWRAILGLAAGTNTVYWRVIALHMSPDQVAAAPIASFTVR